MTHLVRQNEIMTELAQILHDEANSDYDQVVCEYSYLPEYNTFDNYFVISRGGKESNPALSALATVKNSKLAKELRAVMKEHTGGEWASFTLTLDKDGKAHTKFEYPDQDG